MSFPSQHPRPYNRSYSDCNLRRWCTSKHRSSSHCRATTADEVVWFLASSPHAPRECTLGLTTDTTQEIMELGRVSKAFGGPLNMGTLHGGGMSTVMSGPPPTTRNSLFPLDKFSLHTPHTALQVLPRANTLAFPTIGFRNFLHKPPRASHSRSQHPRLNQIPFPPFLDPANRIRYIPPPRDRGEGVKGVLG